MAKTTRANGRTTVEQDTYTIPDIPIKDLLAAIPSVASVFFHYLQPLTSVTDHTA